MARRAHPLGGAYVRRLAVNGSTVVVATDLSEGSAAAARWAADIGRLTGLPVVVAHVVEIGLDSPPWGRYAVALDEAKAAAARSEVAAWFEAQTGGPPTSVDVRLGVCVPVLEEVTRTHDAALLVVSRTGKGALAQALLGSRVQRLAARPPCPLAIVNPLEDTVEPGTFRVGCGTDLSAPGDEALAFAGSLAQLAGGHLTVAHALHLPDIHVGAVEIHPAPQALELEVEMEAALHALVADILPDQTDAECTVLTGPPATALIDLARRAQLDVLVLARTGRMTGLTDVLGSVPRRVVRALPCTVVVTPWRRSRAHTSA